MENRTEIAERLIARVQELFDAIDDWRLGDETIDTIHAMVVEFLALIVHVEGEHR